MTLTEIKPEKRKYVLLGFKYKLVCPDGNQSYTCEVTDTVGYILSKDMKPTRNIDEALVFELDFSIRHSDHMFAFVYVNGLKLNLYLLEEANGFLLHNPLKRKRPTQDEREQVFKKFGGRCAYCGQRISLEDMQVDHIVSHKNHGGQDSIDNYYPACQVCNRVKSDKTIEEFRAEIRNCARIHNGRKRQIMADSDVIAHKYGLRGDGWETKEIRFYFEDTEVEE